MKIFSRTPVKMSKRTGQHNKRNRWKKSSSGVSSKNDRGSSSTTDGLDSDLHSSPSEKHDLDGSKKQLLSDVSSSSCHSGSIPEAVLSTDEYMMMIAHLWQVHQQEHEKYYAKPESHPKYYAEWTHFVQRRSQSIVEFGENPMSYDFESEWKEFWRVRLRELEVEEWNEKKRTSLKFSSEYTKFQRSHKSILSWCSKRASIFSESSSSSRSRSKRRKKSERHKHKRSEPREFKEFHRKGSHKKIKNEKSFSHSKSCKTFDSKKSRRSSINKSGRSRSNSSSRSKSLSHRSRSGSSSRSSSCIRRGRYKKHGKARSKSSSRSRSLSPYYNRSSFSSSNTHTSLGSSKFRDRSSATFRSERGSSSESKNSDRCMMQNSSGFQSERPRLSPCHNFQLRFNNCYSSNTVSCTLKGAAKCASENQHGGRSNERIESRERERARYSSRPKTCVDKKQSSDLKKKSTNYRNMNPSYVDINPIFRNANLSSVSENMKSSNKNHKFWESNIDFESDSFTDANLNVIKSDSPRVTCEIVAKHSFSSPVYCSSSSLLKVKDPILPGLEKPGMEKLLHTQNDNSDRHDIVHSPSSSFLKKAQTWLSALESPEDCTPRVLPSSELKSSDARDCVEHSELKKLGKNKELTLKTEVIFERKSPRIDELSGFKTNNSESEKKLPLYEVKEVLPNHDIFDGVSMQKGISPTQSPSSSIDISVLTKMSPKCIRLASCEETHENTLKPSKEGFCSSLYLELIDQGTLNSKSSLDIRSGDPFIFVNPQSSCHSSSPKTNCLTHFHNSHDKKEILERHTGFAGLSGNISDGINISKSTDEEVQHIRFSGQHYGANVEHRTCVEHPLLKPRSNESDSGIFNLQGVFTENIKGLMDPHDKLRFKKCIDPHYLNSPKKFQSIYGLEDKYREVLPTMEHNLAKSSLHSDVSREPENSHVDNLRLPTDRRLEPHVTVDMTEKCSFLPKVKSGKTVKTLKLLCDLGDTLDNLAPQVMSIYLMALEKEKIGQDPKDSLNQADVRKIIKLVYSKLKASVDSGTIGFMKKTIRMELMEQIEDMLEIGQNLHDKTYGLNIPNLACCSLYLSREQIVDSIRSELINKGKYVPTVDIVTELYSLILDEQLKLV